MRILLDECVHVGVRDAFTGHLVRTVAEIGRKNTPDKSLLEYAENHFEVFVTTDSKMRAQLSVNQYRLGFVFVESWTGRIQELRPVFGHLLKAAERVKSGEFVIVSTK